MSNAHAREAIVTVVGARRSLGCRCRRALSAQDAYPNRPIRLVVGFAAGGPTDIPARYIADKLGDLLGQRVVVENKTGAGGMLATRDVLAQPRDGYKLLLCTHFESINAAVYRNPQYKLDDLAPISLVVEILLRHRALQRGAGRRPGHRSSRTPRPIPARSATRTLGAGSAQEIFARQLERLTGIVDDPRALSRRRPRAAGPVARAACSSTSRRPRTCCRSPRTKKIKMIGDHRAPSG